MKKLLFTNIGIVATTSSFALDPPKFNFNCVTESSTILTAGAQLETLSCMFTPANDISLVIFKAHVIIADTNQVNLQPIGLNTYKDTKLKPLPKIAEQSIYNNKIIAGINGGFFNMTTKGYLDNMCHHKDHTTYGEGDSYLYIDNEDWSYNCEVRPIMIFAEGKEPHLFPMFAPNDTLKLWGEFNLSAIGGGPALVIDKKISIDEQTGKYPWLNQRAARTAIGTNKENHLTYLLNIENRTNFSDGLTIPELAAFMHDQLHVSSAMNLDGGGSSTMCTGINCSNIISPDSELRNIHDGIFIIEKTK